MLPVMSLLLATISAIIGTCMLCCGVRCLPALHGAACGVEQCREALTTLGLPARTRAHPCNQTER